MKVAGETKSFCDRHLSSNDNARAGVRRVAFLEQGVQREEGEKSGIASVAEREK